MRGAVSLFTGLRQEYGLTYDCLVDLEPSFNEGGKQQVYIGSVGKTMPAVLVQGAKAHVVECFHGLNSIGVLAEMFMATELAPNFPRPLRESIVLLPPGLICGTASTDMMCLSPCGQPDI